MLKDSFRTAIYFVLGGLLILSTSCSRNPKVETPEPTQPPTFEPPSAIEEPDELPRTWKEPATPPEETFVETEPSIQEINDKGVLKTIYFEFDKYNLTSEARNALQSNLNWLRDHPEYVVRIEGNCDERGTAEYNLALGDQRATSAKQFLIQRGVGGGRLRTLSYGEEKPLDSRHNESAWAKNRRAEFIIVRKMDR